MSAKTRRRINGYIWNEKMAEMHRKLNAMRRTTDAIIDQLDHRPPSVRLLLTYAAQIALQLNAVTAALREIERIARDYEGEA